MIVLYSVGVKYVGPNLNLDTIESARIRPDPPSSLINSEERPLLNLVTLVR
jgi:hypothetical protein